MSIRSVIQRHPIFGRLIALCGQDVLFHKPIKPTLKKYTVAVVLSGNGVYDGSEINEASAILVRLSRAGVKGVCYAPNENQMQTINHLKGTEDKGCQRNIMIESARIAVNGKIKPLEELTGSAAHAVIFPGGFGVAKNLSDFASNGANMKVSPEVARIILEYHNMKKPIGMCCMASILAAKVLGDKGVEITLGKKDDGSGKWPYGGAIETAKSMGATTVDAEVSEVVIDDKNFVVTTPAFMYNGKFHEIDDGVNLMVLNVLNLI